MSRHLFVRPAVLAAALTATSCSQSAPEPGGSVARSTPGSGAPVVDPAKPGSSVVFEVTPNHADVKLEPGTVELSGTPVVTYYKHEAGYHYSLWLHDGPAGAKIACDSWGPELDKSTVSLSIGGSSPAAPKDLKTLAEIEGGDIAVKKPGQPAFLKGGLQDVVVTFTRTSDTALSGTVSLTATNSWAKRLAGDFNNAIVCEDK